MHFNFIGGRKITNDAQDNIQFMKESGLDIPCIEVFQEPAARQLISIHMLLRKLRCINIESPKYPADTTVINTMYDMLVEIILSSSAAFTGPNHQTKCSV
ncbi:hypothetical protein ACU8KH_03138 [Lachancea thermotolerans]